MPTGTLRFVTGLISGQVIAASITLSSRSMIDLASPEPKVRVSGLESSF